MKLSYPGLIPHLAKTLAPLYFISSDELLLIQESVDAIRKTAESKGFTERVSITAEPSLDIEKCIYEQAHGLSLFATKRIIELNLCHIKFNQATGKLIEAYAKKPLADTILIIYTHKLDSKLEKSAWYQTIEKNGITLPLWPIQTEQLPAWIMQRAKKSNLTMTPSAAELLAREVEGNLLAAAQEIEKLSLLSPNTTIDQQTIDAAVTDNARFDIFNLVDSALIGNRQRSLRILRSLATDDTEPTLVLWALTREIRTLATLFTELKQGIPLASLFTRFRIWDKRQPSVRAFIQRHQRTTCWTLLQHAAKIDRIIKGSEIGNPWEELENLTLNMASNGIIKDTSLI